MAHAIVTGPIPAPPNNGLRAARGLGVVENPSDPLDPNNDWRKGFVLDSHPCDLEHDLRDPCESPNADEKVAQRYGNPNPEPIQPFVIVAGRTCSTFGWEASDLATDAQRLLSAVEYQAIARELWKGEYAGSRGHTANPYLARNPDNLITLSGGNPAIDSMAPLDGLASLEDWIAANCISGGLIHATTRTAYAWMRQDLLIREGGRLFTKLGTQVIVDHAYDGSGPVGPPPGPGQPPTPGQPAAADRAWAYATCGRLTIRLDTQVTLIPGDFAQAVDRETNEITYRAEKLAAVDFACESAAVAVSGCC